MLHGAQLRRLLLAPILPHHSALALDGLLEGVQILDREYRYLYLNPVALAHARQPLEALLGRKVTDVYPGVAATELMRVIRRCMEERVIVQRENEFRYADGTRGWFELHLEPVDEGVIILSVDITARKQAERVALRSHRALATLGACNQALVRATHEEPFAAEVCRVAVEQGGYVMAWIGRPGSDRTIRPMTSAGRDEGYTAAARDTWDDTAQGAAPMGRAVRTGRPHIVRDIREDSSFAPWREAALSRGYLSCGAFPILCDDEVFGAIALYAGETDAFDEAECELLERMAFELGHGLQAMRLRGERHMAEERLQAIFTSSPAAIIALDLEGHVTTWNPGAERLFGWRADEVLGDHLDIIPEDRAAELDALFGRILEGQSFAELELEFQRKNGERAWFLVSTAPWHDAEGQVAGLMAVATDISVRRRDESERALVSRFLRLVNGSVTSAELLRDVVTFLKEELDFDAVGIRLREGEDYPYVETRGFDAEFVELERHLCRVGPNGELVRGADGNPLLECMCGNVIQGRTDASKPFFTPGGSFWANDTTRLLATTTEVDRQSPTRNRCNGEGYESVGLFPLRFGEDCFGLLQLNDRRRGRFTPSRIVLAERLASHIAMALARNRADEERGRSESRYRLLVSNLEDVVYSTDAEGRVEYISPAVERRYGFAPEEVVGRHFADFVHPDDREGLAESFREALAGVVEPYVFRVFDRWGEQHDIRGTSRRRRVEEGVVRGVDGVLVDITAQRAAEREREALREQLASVDRLEAIGRLAGGVAHDFNNLLSVIESYADFAMEALPPSDPVWVDVAEIHAAGKRAAALTRQLLAFSRRQVLEPRVIQPNQVLSGVERMLRRLLGEHIQIETKLAENLGHVRADAGQLEQVLMNLAVNARDAMPGGGTLTIETENVALDEQLLRRSPGLSPGTYVSLRVSDTGSGMTEEVRERIFEPFFTTKATGQGTGLGLATVYGIVKQSGGDIQVESEPGRGSTFLVRLPRVEAPPSVEKDVPPPTVAETSARILVVEDEASVRRLTVRILRGTGYDVVEAANGAEALRLWEEGAEVDLVLSDVVMPNMSGPQLAERLRELRPELPVVFMSGYAEESMLPSGDLGNTPLIKKPFSAAVLTARIHRVLSDIS